MSTAGGLRLPLDGGLDTESDSHAATSIRMARWLLHGGVQLSAGVHAGGVIASVGTHGDADYVYPEITGYYLQWLAWRSSAGDQHMTLAAHAAAAQRWLSTWSQRDDRLQTRIHLRAHAPDWRNQTLFFFDLAMVVRGLASAVRRGLVQPDAALVDSLANALSSLVAVDGRFAACAPCAGGTVPDRWSTRRGGFLAKAAAGVLSAAATIPVLRDLVPAAMATFRDSIEHGLQAPHDESHPFFYGVEGAAAQKHALTSSERSAIVAQVRSRLARVDSHGALPESIDGTGPKRLDVVAQGLRAASLVGVDCHGDARTEAALSRLRRCLHDSIDKRGAVPFAAHDAPRVNTWATMFAHQALDAGDLYGLPHGLIV